MIEQDITSVRSVTDTIDPQFQAVWAEMDRLRKLVADTDGPPPGPPTVRPGFFDPPDKSILRINCTELLGRIAVADSLHDWLDQICERNEWKLFGEPLSKNFTIQFSGDPGTAARRANKALTFLKHRSPDGKWTWDERYVTTQGVSHRIYIGEDKNPAQRKLEYHTKIAERVLRSLYPLLWGPSGTRRLVPNKRDGKLIDANIGICKLTITDENTTTFGWSNERVAALGLSKEEIKHQFALLTARREEQWDV